MTEKELTCIICPTGCRITVTLDGGRIVDIKGNTCQRGKNYAENEATYPLRTLTSTVEVTTLHGRVMLPVRTDRPIPKEALFDGMMLIRRCKAKAPVKTGDVLIADFVESGTNLVACKDID